MITVKFLRDEDMRGVSVMGHAGAAEEGKDIVCAAASALFCTLVGRLEEMKSKIAYWADKGDAYVTCTGGLSTAEKATFEAIECGLLLLAERYPEYVRIE